MVQISLTKNEIFNICSLISDYKSPNLVFSHSFLKVFHKFAKGLKGKDKFTIILFKDDFIQLNNLQRLEPLKKRKGAKK